LLALAFSLVLPFRSDHLLGGQLSSSPFSAFLLPFLLLLLLLFSALLCFSAFSIFYASLCACPPQAGLCG
jgi:hypothetical protein